MTPDPYAPPATPLREDDGPPGRSVGLLAFAWGTLLVMAGLAALAIYLIDEIGPMLDADWFRRMGAHVTEATRLVVRLRDGWLAFPLAALVLALDTLRRPVHAPAYRRAARRCLIGLLIFAVLCAGFFYWAMIIEPFGHLTST